MSSPTGKSPTVDATRLPARFPSWCAIVPDRRRAQFFNPVPQLRTASTPRKAPSPWRARQGLLSALALLLATLPDTPVCAQSPPLTVDTQNRADVVRFFDEVYQASRLADAQWDGDVAACRPGTNSLAYSEATILRVNYFRAMAGLPGDITLNQAWSDGCQAAALVCAAARNAAHVITPDWPCYSPEAAETALRSNLMVGDRGPTAIDRYLDDPGAENDIVGHRRWVLYPPQKTMGTGSIPRQSPHQGANALRVIGGHGARPAGPEWVAWPPPGFVPWQVMPRESSRWSFSLPEADFSAAQVVVTHLGEELPLTFERQANDEGIGDNTLVWRPEGIPIRAPAMDLRYEVRLSGVKVGATERAFSYEVILIDPARIVDAVAPRIVTEPEDQSAALGDQVRFQVEASGSEPLTFQWSHQETPIDGATTSVLVLSSVRSEDAGLYQVKAWNDAGTAFSRAARLTVQEPLSLEIARGIDSPSTISLRWVGDGVLQQSDSLPGPWKDLDTSSPFTNPATRSAEFYRLRQR